MKSIVRKKINWSKISTSSKKPENLGAPRRHAAGKLLGAVLNS
jgi:hypothetical protein